MGDAQVPCTAALAEVGEGSVDKVAVQKTAKNCPRKPSVCSPGPVAPPSKRLCAVVRR